MIVYLLHYPNGSDLGRRSTCDLRCRVPSRHHLQARPMTPRTFGVSTAALVAQDIAGPDAAVGA